MSLERKNYSIQDSEIGRSRYLHFIFLGVAIHCFVADNVFAYRPFESTDAPVVATDELGTTMARHLDETAQSVPEAAITYGVAKKMELGIGASLDLIDDKERFNFGFRALRFREFGISTKYVLSTGEFETERGWLPMIAIEAELVAERVDVQDMSGDTGVVIAASGWLGPIPYHLNVGGLWETDTGDAGFSWGVALEYPLHPNIRPMIEANGQNLANHRPEFSFLGGVIWSTPWNNVDVDIGARRRLTAAGPDWAATLGLTFAFSTR